MTDEILREMQNPKSLILEVIERLTKVETQLENKVDKADLAVFQQEMKTDFAVSQQEMKTDFAVSQQEMKTDFKDMESKQLKWLIGTILACFVVLGAFLKYF